MAKGKTDHRQSGCPIAFTLDVIGDKWSFIIIRDMIFRKRRYFSEFLEAKENIATNILADRLKKLEENGIITKTKDPNHQKKYIYRITPKGIDLIPMILEFILWGTENDPQTITPEKLYKRLYSNKQKFADEVIEAMSSEAGPSLPPIFAELFPSS